MQMEGSKHANAFQLDLETCRTATGFVVQRPCVTHQIYSFLVGGFYQSRCAFSCCACALELDNARQA